MYRLTIKTGFAAAHNLINYQGDCENLHGHNWKVEVTVIARELDKAGLAIDFKVLKKRPTVCWMSWITSTSTSTPFFRNCHRPPRTLPVFSINGCRSG